MISSLALLLFPLAFGNSQTLLETCNDMKVAVDATKNGDVDVLMYPFARIECANFTTFTLLEGNDLTITSSENLENYHGSSTFENVRFEVVNGSSLSIENNAFFRGFDEQDVNGGAIFVGKGSSVTFMNDFTTRDVGVRSVTDESSDFASYQLSGGVIYNEGKITIEGVSEFYSCENGGGGESSPGPGGCVYNGETGFMLFKGGVHMNEVSIIDDEGNNGAGFYNVGRVNIWGDSKFSEMYAETAGAIYNEKGAKFNFRKGASVIFSECKASDGKAGVIYNNGEMKFTGPALFLEGRSYWVGGAIVIGGDGDMKMSKDSVFFKNISDDDSGAPVFVHTGGSLDISMDDVHFIENLAFSGEPTCGTVFFEEDGVCL